MGSLILNAVQELTPTSHHDQLPFAALFLMDFYALMRLVSRHGLTVYSFNHSIKLCPRGLCAPHNQYIFVLPSHKTVEVGYGNEILVCSFTPQ